MQQGVRHKKFNSQHSANAVREVKGERRRCVAVSTNQTRHRDGPPRRHVALIETANSYHHPMTLINDFVV